MLERGLTSTTALICFYLIALRPFIEKGDFKNISQVIETTIKWREASGDGWLKHGLRSLAPTIKTTLRPAPPSNGHAVSAESCAMRERSISEKRSSCRRAGKLSDDSGALITKEAANRFRRLVRRYFASKGKTWNSRNGFTLYTQEHWQWSRAIDWAETGASEPVNHNLPLERQPF